MNWCNKCGEPIVFKKIDGRSIPIHINGQCTRGGFSGIVTGYSRAKNQDICTHTACPICGESVFFIRHNGGSVWIDSPLGPPWSKHPCFNAQTYLNTKTSLASYYGIADSSGGIKVLFGQVGPNSKSEYEMDSNKLAYTVQYKNSEVEGFKKLKIKYCPEVILGKLCFYEQASGLIWPIDEPTHKLSVVD